MPNVTRLLFVGGVIATCDDCECPINPDDDKDCLAYFDTSKCDACLIKELASYEPETR